MKHKKYKISSYDDLIKNYYGNFHHGRHHHHKKMAYEVSKSFDTGEVLVQNTTGPVKDFEEYVAQCALPVFEEYIISESNLPAAYSMAAFNEYEVTAAGIEMQASLEDKTNTGTAAYITPEEEYRLDIMNLVKQENTAAKDAAPNASIEKAASYDLPFAEPAADSPKAKLSDDDFAADLQSIFEGKSVFDPVSKKTVSKDQLGAPAAGSNLGSPGAQEPDFKKSEHAIFDKIAQSMQFANAYDMGSIDLENRFAVFDNDADRMGKKKAPKKQSLEDMPEDNEDSTAGNTEFIKDLDIIKKQVKQNMQAANAAKDAITDFVSDIAQSKSTEADKEGTTWPPPQ
jgi:hypothetical protein